MAGRFKRQLPTPLEIRGISRGSLVNHPKADTYDDEILESSNIHSHPYYGSICLNNNNLDDDEDESTITAGSQPPSSPQSPLNGEDIITASDTSHYWSAGNSYTTGNTTERSSLYSWGDDEFDHQASKLVRQMFQAIEQMLFEGVLSGSTSLQQECRQWMFGFPHLRIIGKQVMATRDEGFLSVPSTTPASSAVTKKTPAAVVTPQTSFSSAESKGDAMSIEGVAVTPQPVPDHLLSSMRSSGATSCPLPGCDISHLQEEILEQDGQVEEYIAYDIIEIDDEEHSKRFHEPRRRRLGFPPITPNACVRDAVLHQLFDVLWSRVVSALAHHAGRSPSLLESLMVKVPTMGEGAQPSSNHIFFNEQRQHLEHQIFTSPTQVGLTQHPFNFDLADDEGTMLYNSLRPLPGVVYHPHHASSFAMQHNNQLVVLPPSRGSYLDHAGGLSGPGRHFSHATGRLSTAPHPNNPPDPGSLSDLMTISQKKLQVRSDKAQSSDDLPPPLHDARMTSSAQRPASSSHFLNGGGISTPSGGFHPGAGFSPHPIVGGGSRMGANRDVNSSMSNVRGMSTATGGGRKVSRAPPRAVGRLQPLDRSKTPNPEFDGFVKATKLTRPGGLEPSASSLGSLHPPPTAPNLSGGGSLWVSNRLPPINSLESLNENSALEFKKTRGKTAYTRISSALATDDKNTAGYRMFENMSRPNTTHTFRTDGNNLFNKRSASGTPSHLTLGAHGNSLLGQVKSASPSGFNPTTSSYHNQPQYSASSPDHMTGLAGITGIGINVLGSGNLVGSTQHQTGDEGDAPTSNHHNNWGATASSQSLNVSNQRPARKRPVLGFSA